MLRFPFPFLVGLALWLTSPVLVLAQPAEFERAFPVYSEESARPAGVVKTWLESLDVSQLVEILRNLEGLEGEEESTQALVVESTLVRWAVEGRVDYLAYLDASGRVHAGQGRILAGAVVDGLRETALRETALGSEGERGRASELPLRHGLEYLLTGSPDAPVEVLAFVGLRAVSTRVDDAPTGVLLAGISVERLLAGYKGLSLRYDGLDYHVLALRGERLLHGARPAADVLKRLASEPVVTGPVKGRTDGARWARVLDVQGRPQLIWGVSSPRIATAAARQKATSEQAETEDPLDRIMVWLPWVTGCVPFLGLLLWVLLLHRSRERKLARVARFSLEEAREKQAFDRRAGSRNESEIGAVSEIGASVAAMRRDVERVRREVEANKQKASEQGSPPAEAESSRQANSHIERRVGDLNESMTLLKETLGRFSRTSLTHYEAVKESVADLQERMDASAFASEDRLGRIDELLGALNQPVTERLAEVETRLGTLSNSSEQNFGEVLSSLREELAAFRSTFEAEATGRLLEVQSSIGERLESLELKLSGLTADGLGGVELKFGERFEALDSAIGQLRGSELFRLETLFSERLEALELKLSGLTADGIGGLESSLSSRVDALADQLGQSQEASRASLESRLDRLSSEDLAGLGERLADRLDRLEADALERTSEGLGRVEAALAERLDLLGTSLAERSAETDAKVLQTLATIDARIENQSHAGFNGLDAKLGAFETELSRLTAEHLDELRERFDQVSERLGSLVDAEGFAARFEALDGHFEGLALANQERLADLEGRLLAPLGERLTGLEELQRDGLERSLEDRRGLVEQVGELGRQLLAIESGVSGLGDRYDHDEAQRVEAEVTRGLAEIEQEWKERVETAESQLALASSQSRAAEESARALREKEVELLRALKKSRLRERALQEKLSLASDGQSVGEQRALELRQELLLIQEATEDQRALLETLRGENEDLRSQLVQTESSEAEGLTLRRQLEAEVAELRQRLEEQLETGGADREALRLRQEALERHREELRESVAADRARCEALEAECEGLRAELARGAESEELSSLRAELEEARQALGSLESEHDSLRLKSQGQNSYEAERELLRRELEEREREVAAFREALETERSAPGTRLVELESERDQARSELALDRERLGEFESRCAELDREAELLRDELAEARRERAKLEMKLDESSDDSDRFDVLHEVGDDLISETGRGQNGLPQDIQTVFTQGVVRSIPVGLVVTGIDHEVLVWNAHAERLLEVTEEEVLGQDVRGLASRLNSKRFKKCFEKAVRRGKPTRFTMDDTDEGVRFLVTFSPFHSAGNELQGHLLLVDRGARPAPLSAG